MVNDIQQRLFQKSVEMTIRAIVSQVRMLPNIHSGSLREIRLEELAELSVENADGIGVLWLGRVGKERYNLVMGELQSASVVHNASVRQPITYQLLFGAFGSFTFTVPLLSNRRATHPESLLGLLNETYDRLSSADHLEGVEAALIFGEAARKTEYYGEFRVVTLPPNKCKFGYAAVVNAKVEPMLAAANESGRHSILS